MSNNQTIASLNNGLQTEMSAAHQYQLHAHVLEDWGLNLLAATMRTEMAEEIDHSDRLIGRILFFKGDPEFAFAEQPRRAASLVDMFNADPADEVDTLAFYA